MIKKIFFGIIFLALFGLVAYFYMNGYFDVSAGPASSENFSAAEKAKMDKVICGVSDPSICEVDEDCVCADEDTKFPGCFIGNKYFYEKCEDKSHSCADNCIGWGQPPVRCINGKCSNVYDRVK